MPVGVKIERVEAVPTTIEDLLGEPLHLCLIRIEAEGLVGWGEVCDSYCCTFPRVYEAVVADVLAPLLEGVQLEAVEPLARKLRTWARRRLGDAGVGVQAVSGVELALWDLLGKAEGRSVSSLVGGLRDRIPVYASGKFLDEPIPMHQELFAPAFDRGVTTAKVRAGTDWRASLAVLEELRGLLPGGLDLLVDGNEHFNVVTATRFAAGLHDLGVLALEEPVPQVNRAGITRLTASTPLAIAYGEHLYGAVEFAEALAGGWPDIVQPDPAISGGLGECLRIASHAEGFGVPVIPHSSAGPFALASALTLASARQNVSLVEHSFTLETLWERLVGTGLSRSSLVDGHLTVPPGPGWGLDVDEAALRAHPYRPSAYDTALAVRSVGIL